jgi:hypothetical protein
MRKSHAIAFYGSTRYKQKVKVTYKTTVTKKRKDGVKQRYHKRVTATRYKQVKGGQRLTVYGSPEEIKQVKEKIDSEGWIPKRKYVDRVSADLFLRDPKKYARKGVWIDFDEDES